MTGAHRHEDPAEELRLLGIALLDRIEPGVQSLLAAIREPAAGAAEQGGQRPVACEWCPLCSAIALLRGERPEVAARIADHANGLLAALRAVLSQPPVEQPGAAPAEPPRVQRIKMRPADADG
jgi:hypothetical protein